MCLKYLTNGEHSMVHHPISFFLKRFFVPRTWSVCCDQISDFFLKIWCCMGFCYLPGVVIWQHIHPSSFTWINPLWAFFLLSRKHTPFRCGRCWQPPLCPPTSVRWSNCLTRCLLQMFLKPQVCVEYGNRTREHQSGHQSSYWLRTNVLNLSDLTRTGVTH